MFMTSWESFTPWVLLIEQKTYLPYIKGDKKAIAKYRPISLLNLDYKIYTIYLFLNQMQKTFGPVTMIGEHQSEAIKIA